MSIQQEMQTIRHIMRRIKEGFSTPGKYTPTPYSKFKGGNSKLVPPKIWGYQGSMTNLGRWIYYLGGKANLIEFSIAPKFGDRGAIHGQHY